MGRGEPLAGAQSESRCSLVSTPALVEHGGQVGYFLWLAWIVFASIALARRRGAPDALQLDP